MESLDGLVFAFKAGVISLGVIGAYIYAKNYFTSSSVYISKDKTLQKVGKPDGLFAHTNLIRSRDGKIDYDLVQKFSSTNLSVDYLDGFPNGKCNGLVDSIHKNSADSSRTIRLYRKTDYEIHQPEFDLGDKILRNAINKLGKRLRI